MKRIGTLVVAICATAVTAVFAAGTAVAGAAEGSWYIAPQVNANVNSTAGSRPRRFGGVE